MINATNVKRKISMDACICCILEALRILHRNIGLNQFRFLLKQHGPFHLVKVKLEIAHGRQQSSIFL